MDLNESPLPLPPLLLHWQSSTVVLPKLQECTFQAKVDLPNLVVSQEPNICDLILVFYIIKPVRRSQNSNSPLIFLLETITF